MGELLHIPDRTTAMRTILDELDWSYKVQMHLIDLIGDIPGHDEAVHFGNLRNAAARSLRQSMERRDAAIQILDREAI